MLHFFMVKRKTYVWLQCDTQFYFLQLLFLFLFFVPLINKLQHKLLIFFQVFSRTLIIVYKSKVDLFFFS